MTVFSSKSITNSGGDVNLSENRFSNKYGEVVSDSDARSNLFGYLIHTSKMMVYLPQEKITLLRKEIRSLLDNCFPKIRQVARVIGLIVSTFPAVYPGPLHYRFWKRKKRKRYN